MDLQEYRNKIDGIDRQLVELFIERMKTSADIADYKSANYLPVLDKGRERELLLKIAELCGEEYENYVSEILIEGHTDSLGTYLDNLALSQQRALAVASYVLDDDYRGISARQKSRLREVVTANGRSFSDPVLDANGFEDMDASRRVVFKFRLTDEQMIQQLKSILEENDS